MGQMVEKNCSFEKWRSIADLLNLYYVNKVVSVANRGQKTENPKIFLKRGRTDKTV